MTRRTTQRPKRFAAVRIADADRDLWFVAAKVLGISQSEFLRRTLREAAVRTIAEARAEAVTDR
jgi:prophage antirepressor-like protein